VERNNFNIVENFGEFGDQKSHDNPFSQKQQQISLEKKTPIKTKKALMSN
jgi:hypothetical protein